MKKFYGLLFLLLNLFCLQAQTLQNIESVEYDPTQNRFFISNGNSILQQNANGDLDFFGNGSATNGMEVMGDHLFVIDGGRIRGYDLVSAEEVMSINIPGASFLNGMTSDGDATLYITDFATNRIHQVNVADLDNPTSQMIVPNTGSTPNGIVYDGANNRVIFVSWGGSAAIKAVDLTDNSVSTIVTTTFGNIDGIDEDNEGNYYISTWSPSQIAKYDNDFANPPEIITTPFLSNPADICYAKEIDTLAIPHYPPGLGNEVVYVGFENIGTANHNIQSTDFELKVFPNPISDLSVIEFTLEERMPVSLTLYNQQGQLINTLMSGEQMNGQHTISFQGHKLTAGMYWLKLESENMLKTIAISVK